MLQSGGDLGFTFRSKVLGRRALCQTSAPGHSRRFGHPWPNVGFAAESCRHRGHAAWSKSANSRHCPKAVGKHPLSRPVAYLSPGGRKCGIQSNFLLHARLRHAWLFTPEIRTRARRTTDNGATDARTRAIASGQFSRTASSRPIRIVPSSTLELVERSPPLELHRTTNTGEI